MDRRLPMLRRVLSLIAVLAFTAQGVAQASVDVPHGDQAQTHCEGHQNPSEDCTCCPDSLPQSGCAGLCSLMSALPSTQAEPALHANERVIRANDACARGPAYLPLNPPPIA